MIDDDKSQCVYLKDFNRFMFHKTKNNNKKCFCKSCLQCFSSENMLIKHKEDCLNINGVQFVGVEQGTIEFQNYFKQLAVPFKIYADFECNLESKVCEMKFVKVLTLKNIMIIFLVVLLTKLFVLIINLVSQLLSIEMKMQHMNLLKQFLKSISTVKK